MKKAKKINLDKLSGKKVDKIALDIGEKVKHICDKAADEINVILKAYGMSAKIAIAFDHDTQVNLKKEPQLPKRA